MEKLSFKLSHGDAAVLMRILSKISDQISNQLKIEFKPPVAQPVEKIKPAKPRIRIPSARYAFIKDWEDQFGKEIVNVRSSAVRALIHKHMIDDEYELFRIKEKKGRTKHFKVVREREPNNKGRMTKTAQLVLSANDFEPLLH